MLDFFKNILYKSKNSDSERLDILNKIKEDFHVAYNNICETSTNYKDVVSEDDAWNNTKMPMPEELTPYLHSWGISSNYHREKVTFKNLPKKLNNLANSYTIALNCFYRKREYDSWKKSFSYMSFEKFKKMPRK